MMCFGWYYNSCYELVNELVWSSGRSQPCIKRLQPKQGGFFELRLIHILVIQPLYQLEAVMHQNAV